MTAYTHPDIHRPDYCSCETPWQTPDGPLKDGSHYSGCMAAEVAEDMATFSLEEAAGHWWLMYQHADGIKCTVTQVNCPAVLETLGALLGVDVSGRLDAGQRPTS